MPRNKLHRVVLINAATAVFVRDTSEKGGEVESSV